MRAYGLAEYTVLLFFGLCPLQVVNPHLLKDLTERGLWSEEMKNQIIAHNGSIQVCVRNQGERRRDSY